MDSNEYKLHPGRLTQGGRYIFLRSSPCWGALGGLYYWHVKLGELTILYQQYTASSYIKIQHTLMGAVTNIDVYKRSVNVTDPA